MHNWKRFDPSPIYVPHLEQNIYTWLDDTEYSTPIKFEVLSHVTTFENAETILNERELKSHRVNGYSCVTKFQHPTHHPLYMRKILWVSPDTYSTMQVQKHGNVRFYTNNLDFMKELNFYFVEFLEIGSQNIARILVTSEKYKELHKFDVKRDRSGPISLDHDGHFVKYNFFKKYNWTQFEQFEIEIMLEVPECINTIVSYVKCENPRSVLKSGHPIGRVPAYNDSIGELKYALLRYRHRFNSAFFINPLDAHCQDAMTIINNADLTSQWYPMTRNISCHSNNVNELVTHLDLVASWQNKVIVSEDEESIEDLHFVFTETGELPSALAMIHKLIDTSIEAFTLGRELETPLTDNTCPLFQQIFELFLDHFKTHEAQGGIKEVIMKFMEAAYNLDINRTLHGSQIPIEKHFHSKLTL